MKAVKKFKDLIDDRRKSPMGFQSVFGKGVRTAPSPDTSLHNFQHPYTQQNQAQERPSMLHASKSLDLDDRRPIESALVAQGVHPDLRLGDSVKAMDNRVDSSMVSTGDLPADQAGSTGNTINSEIPRVDSFGDRGHAHDPLDEQPLFLGIGAGTGEAVESDSVETSTSNFVAESPTAAEFSIYDTAYEQEVERIRAAQGSTAKVYLTRRVDGKKRYTADDNMIKVPKLAETFGAHTGFKSLIDRARDKEDKTLTGEKDGNKISTSGKDAEKQATTNQTFSELASKLLSDTKDVGKDLHEKGGSAFNTLVQRAAEKKEEYSTVRKG
jgi:[calcium/calmodulin-dependent protein kinase] kinase